VNLARVSLTAGLAALAALAVLASACSGSGGGSPSTPPESAPGASGSSAPAGSSAAATGSASAAGSPSATTSGVSAAALAKIVLQPGDLPAGWKPTKHDTSGDDSSGNDALGKQIASCIGVPAPPQQDNDKNAVHSPDYTSGNNEIDSSAEPATRPDAERDFINQVIASPKAPGCFDKFLRVELRKSMPAGATIGKVQAKVTRRQAGQPKNVVADFTAQVQVTLSGQTVTVITEDVDMLSDTVEGEVDFVGVGAPIPALVRQQALATVGGRVAST